MYSLSLKYAITCGLFLTILFHLSFFYMANPYIDINHLFFDFLIFCLFLFFALKEFKNFKNEGILHFWQAMTISFYVYIQASLLFSFYLIVYHYLNPELLESYKTEAMAFLTERSEMYVERFGEAQLEQQKEAIAQTTARSLILQATIKKISIGLFSAPIISILLRKKPKN